MTALNSGAPLSPLEKALKDSLVVPQLRDVYLYAFSRRTTFPDGTSKIGHPIATLAIGSILKESEHFSKLLTCGFTESHATGETASAAVRAYALDDEYDYESDSDLDVFEDLTSPESGALKSEVDMSTIVRCSSQRTTDPSEEKGRDEECPSAPTAGLSTACIITREEPEPIRHRIFLPSVAHRTLRAFVFYMYTGRTNFLPLGSASGFQRQLALLTAGDTTAPACSPKSMFRLAESYGMIQLQELAYLAIVERLTPTNIVAEAFSPFFARYDRLREHAVSYISRNYANAEVQSALQDALDSVLLGHSPHAGGVLRSLLGLQITQVRRDGPSPSILSQSTWEEMQHGLKGHVPSKGGVSKAKDVDCQGGGESLRKRKCSTWGYR